MMNYLQKQKRSKKGFTLMEMLIVIAIIAILIAIAIPIFQAQLNDARDRVEEANMRSAQSMAYAQYLLDEDTDGATYYALVDAKQNMTVVLKNTPAPDEPTDGAAYTVTIGTDGKTSVEKGIE